VLWPNVFSHKVADIARTARCLIRLQQDANRNHGDSNGQCQQTRPL
jgi:hypothetical protein